MATSTNYISYVGEVEVTRANIVTPSKQTIDIRSLIIETSIYEDIFSNTLSGHVIIQDSLDLINNVPLIGQEILDLDIKTPSLSESITKTFYIYKLQQHKTSSRSQTYMLNFCSKELIYATNTKVAQAFSGNIGETVTSIFRDDRYIGSTSALYVDTTKNNYSFIAPYWSPFETINWISAKAINKRGVPNYLFFETSKSFEFTSIDTLVQAKSIREYVYSDVGPSTVYGANGDIDFKYSIVESINTDVTFDYLRSLKSGMYSSKLYTFDMTTKNINSNSYDYLDNFNDSNHLNKYPIQSDLLLRKRLASLYFIEKNNYQTGHFKPQGYKDFFLQRNALIAELSAFKLNIKVPGRTDIKVGQVIKFTIPQMRQLLIKELGDKSGMSDYFSGRYLITAIKHQIVNGKHDMTMEIVSESFVKKLLS